MDVTHEKYQRLVEYTKDLTPVATAAARIRGIGLSVDGGWTAQ